MSTALPGIWSSRRQTGGGGAYAFTYRDSDTTDTLSKVAYGNGYWHSAGGTIGTYSSNSTSWTSHSMTTGCQGSGYGNNYHVVGHQYWVITYSNGTPPSSWSSATTPWSSGYCHGVAYGGSATIGWVGVGDLGRLARIGATSPVGSWLSQSTPHSNRMRHVCMGSSYMVAVSDNGDIIRSNNGTTWSAVTSGVTSGIAQVAYGNSKFVAPTGGDDLLVSSDDGATWTKYQPAATGITVGSNLGATSYDSTASRWVCGDQANGKILASSGSDPTTGWSEVSSPFNSSGNVIYGGGFGDGYVVLVGTGGKLATSFS